MDLTVLLTAIIFGTLTGNVLLSSGIGLDLVSNNLNSIKNALIFSLYVVCITIISGIVVWLANFWLVSVENAGFIVLVGFMIVSIVVQLAEFIMMKISPIVYTHVKEILVVLIPTISIVLFSLIGNGVGFGEFILNLLFSCVGMVGVMLTINGVRQNKITSATYDVFRGNLMTIVVLFVVSLVWMAI